MVVNHNVMLQTWLCHYRHEDLSATSLRLAQKASTVSVFRPSGRFDPFDHSNWPSLSSLMSLNICVYGVIIFIFCYFCVLQYIIGHVFVYFSWKSNRLNFTSDQNCDSEYEYVFVFDIFLSSMSSQILLRSESLCEYLGDSVKNTPKNQAAPWWDKLSNMLSLFLMKQTGRSSNFTQFSWSLHKKKHNKIIEGAEEKEKTLTDYLISFWVGGARETFSTPGSPSVASRRWMGSGFHGADSAPTHLSVVGNLLSISALDVPNPARCRHATATSRHSSAAVKRRWKNRPTTVRLAVAPFWSSSAWAKSPPHAPQPQFPPNKHNCLGRWFDFMSQKESPLIG